MHTLPYHGVVEETVSSFCTILMNVYLPTIPVNTYDWKTNGSKNWTGE